jgi:putative transposase
MTNHVHLLVTPYTKDVIGKLMQRLGRYYVQYFNHCYKRSGTLWEGRYKATLIVSKQYLFTCMRFIELNPLRVGMVTPQREYRLLGKTDAQRQSAYRQMFETQLAEKALDEIRSATNKSWVLGSVHSRPK